jgi:hypothetical protein
MMSDRDFAKWIRDYDNLRLGSGRRLGWHSTKFDLESKDWDAIKEEQVPELDCTFAQACNYLRKSWKRFKRLRRETGDRGWDIILTINRILDALGLELIEFRNGPEISWIRHQLQMEKVVGVQQEQSSEDIEVKYEEYLDRRDDSSDNDEYDYEMSREEVQQIKREEEEERRERVNEILEQMGVEPNDSSTEDY